jgi:Uma2 family endonuclease
MMTPIRLQGLEGLELKANDPEQRMLISGVNWQQYETLLKHLENSSSYRITYLDGMLEIMAPSRRHEVSKEDIGRLVEAYLEYAEIDFWGLGSTTLRKQEKEAGKEPDKCFCLFTDKEFPDLAIEVVLTSGSLKVLEVYKRLGTQEVWFWQDNQLKIYALSENDEYILIPKSALLPDLNLDLLSQYINHPNPRLAVKEFRSQLSKNSQL